ncbi:MAG TPA: type II toxin-antitoxin system HicB family antitoxin [Thermosulfurimonas dismutans]|uniref:Type II toxin-antitoxin system HicB family antitoxin n=1 Tax=Thermosulfurimonas dismutans TaxID=999894 RepID=A0A7C3CPH6_9BACT|nr:type II toxin-antitoxin system HicB family antitoxin [Thermosulfurimonas sp.]HFC98675.1 type II toxin-antitoxin system HicB family antitoxin [Thermosulfurimonas dismutans]
MEKRVLNFVVILEPDPSGGYVVSCPELPGCYSQGESVEEALENIKEAILLTLEDLAESEEPLPESRKILVSTVSVSI